VAKRSIGAANRLPAVSGRKLELQDADPLGERA
jgi:hypothetical protein